MSTDGEDQELLELEEYEKRQIDRRVAAGAVIVHEAVRLEGEAEISRHAAALMWSGLAAGLSMGISFLASVLINAYLPGDSFWHPAIYSIGYALGFVVVVLGRQQLFTENTITAVLPLLYHRNMSHLIRLLRLWGIVLAANLAGVAIFAAVMAYMDVLGPEFKQSLITISSRAEQVEFWRTMLGGVFAGWLIALMVWLLPVAETASVWIVLLITYLVGLANFPHVIAGSTEAIYSAMTGQTSAGDYLLEFLVPALVGNIVGGVVFVAALNHAQATVGRRGRNRDGTRNAVRRRDQHR